MAMDEAATPTFVRMRYVSYSDGVMVIGGPIKTLEPLECEPACKNPDCSRRPFNLVGMVYGDIPHEVTWSFSWGIPHGYGACASCGYWHRIYFYSETGKLRDDQPPEMADKRIEATA